MVNKKKKHHFYYKEFKLNEDDARRVTNLANYAKYKAEIASLKKSKTNYQKDIFVLRTEIEILEKPIPRERNHRLIYQKKKLINEKNVELIEIKNEINSLQKATIQNKPENLLREILKKLGKGAKIITKVRANFVTVDDRPGMYKFETTGVGEVRITGIKSFNEVLKELNSYFAATISRIQGDLTDEKFRYGNVRLQGIGNENAAIISDRSTVFYTALNLISKLARPTEDDMNQIVNRLMGKSGIVMHGSITFRYIISKEVIEEIPGSEGKSHRKMSRKFSIPGVDTVTFRINGGTEDL